MNQQSHHFLKLRGLGQLYLTSEIRFPLLCNVQGFPTPGPLRKLNDSHMGLALDRSPRHVYYPLPSSRARLPLYKQSHQTRDALPGPLDAAVHRSVRKILGAPRPACCKEA